jgi:hypothetical protein
MSFAAITLCVASQRVFIIVVVYFVIDSVRKLLDTPSYNSFHPLIEIKQAYNIITLSLWVPHTVSEPTDRFSRNLV